MEMQGLGSAPAQKFTKPDLAWMLELEAQPSVWGSPEEALGV